MYEPKSKTAIVQGCDYYGWVKSIALGIVADFLEDFTSEHRRHSVHGSFIDSKGQGIAMIGPSGSGKTTLTYGLLLDKSFSFVTDDWFFVRFAANDSLVYSSEKNSYIRGDLADAWPVYSPKLKGIKQDNRQRSIVDVKKLIGQDRIRHESNLVATVLLTRDKSLMPFRKLNAKEAIEFMLKNNFCNPHQLVKNKEKLDKRKKFFSELFRRAPVYLLNTIETPAESMQRIKDIWNK
jgi:serine kinase of HPr protein (carbohydrate metabolism regulator)